MKCPNCSAECADQSLECDFCGHPFTKGTEQAAPLLPPVPPVVTEPPPLRSIDVSQPPANPYSSSGSSNVAKVIPNHLIWASVVTVIATLSTMLSCCFLPLGLPSGIAAIVYALRVNKFMETGEVASAEQASRNAKIWSWVTTVIAIIFSIWLIALFANIFTDPAFLKELNR